MRLGLGVGIIAKIALKKDQDYDLNILPVDHLFQRSTTKMVFRSDWYLPQYALKFMELFSPIWGGRKIKDFIELTAPERKKFTDKLKIPTY